MTINKYKLTIVDGYIKGLTNDLSQEGQEWEGQASVYSKEVDGYEIGMASGCYKYQNGNIVFDENKCNEIVAQLKVQDEINELKAYLNETDYIWNSIREGGRTEEYYAEVIEKRKQARKRIQELENKKKPNRRKK